MREISSLENNLQQLENEVLKLNNGLKAEKAKFTE